MAGTKNTMKAVVARGVGDYRVEEVVPGIQNRRSTDTNGK